MKKTAKIIIGLLLTALGLPTASAQQTQDALYIFRNDGQFNAFFWGDIQRFAYSKVDTLGIEHDDYVVQEVYALDSVFRIPVSAIDSIAFVTPENKVKSDVFQPGRQIGDYIVASDSLYWIRLAPSTPQALIPKKGDKLLITGNTTGAMYLNAEEIRYDLKPVEEAQQGWRVSIPVPDKVRPNDKFFKLEIVKK